MNNYSEHMKNIYHNIMIHHQQIAYANMMVALSTSKSEPSTTAPIIKIEPGLTPQTSPEIQTVTSPAPLHAASTSFSLDTEIPREEIEGDIEVIMVRHFQDNLKTLDTTLNGLRGKKFGYRELLEISQARPTYYTTTVIKRDRTTSVGSSDACTSLNSTENDQNAKKKPKMDNTVNNNADDSLCSDDGRLMIDWNDPEKEEKTEETKIHIKQEKVDANVIKTANIKADEEYKPSHIRFERLKHIMNKKKPRFNVDNLNLTYHSNMARNFPGTENRTEEQQERRNKNTLAARISRNKNKIYEQVLEKQSLNAMIENINLKRQVSMLRVYANSLMKLSGFADADFSKMWEENIKEMLFDTSQ